ncbi:hypothetical protein D3C72_2170480 [compost metagenome]
MQDAGEAVFAKLVVADDAVAEGLKLQRLDPNGRGRGGQGIGRGHGTRHVAEAAGGVFVANLLQGIGGLRRRRGTTGRKHRKNGNQTETDGLFHGTGVSIHDELAWIFRR